MMSDDDRAKAVKCLDKPKTEITREVRRMISDDDRAKVVMCLVDFIDKVTKKERPSKAEVEVLPEVVRALREFITVQNS